MIRGRVGEILARVLPRLAPDNLEAHYIVGSLILSELDAGSTASESLITCALRAIEAARDVDLGNLDTRWRETPAAREGEPFLRPSAWPGEHYRLLAGLTLSLQPRLILEVGTGGGLSALAMKACLPPESKIVTFDLIGWQAGRPFNVLRSSDFEDDRLAQHLGDLSAKEVFARYSALVSEADLIFIDGPKDGRTERSLLGRLAALEFKTPPIVVLDDIRLWNLLALWRAIPYPKLDLTSFGHWSGTGLVEWPSRGSNAGNP